MKKMIINLCITLFVLPAWAQNPINTSASKAKKSNIEEGLSYKVTLGAKTTAQAETQSDGSRSQNIEYTITPEMSFSDYTLMTSLSYTQELLESKKSEMSDIPLILNRKDWKFDYVGIAPEGFILFPVKEKTRDVVQLKYTLGITMNLNLDLQQMLSWDSARISYSLGYAKSVTDYSTSTKGDPNIDYRIRQRLNYSYKFSDEWSLKFRFQFDSNYGTDDELKNAFTHFQSVEYAYSKKLKFSAGHSNSDSLYHKETYESNLKLYDSSTSELFFGVSYSI